MNFVLPSKSQVGYLDPEIAGEGQKVILSDGEQISWNPPPPKVVMPDWSQIKSIAKYFNRTGFQVYPAWLYHPSEQPRIVKNAAEAGELGVCYREATQEERARYGVKAVWDWQDDSKWRAEPYPDTLKFDPLKPGQGKTFVPTPQNPAIAQNAMIEALIPAVAAAVAQSLKATGPSAPPSIDPAQWEEFLAFQAWQKTMAAVDVIKGEQSPASESTAGGNVGASNGLTASALSEGQAVNALTAAGLDRAKLIEEAEGKNIKVDKRWSTDRLLAELELVK